MGSALLQQSTLDLAGPLDAALPGAAADALRTAVAERLAAHRTRRARQAPLTSVTDAPAPLAADSNAARIAATVAGRYAQAQSYRAFLAAEAERAIQQAQAAAEAAAITARAVAEAQQQVLALLEQQGREAALRQHVTAEPLSLWVGPDTSPTLTPAAPVQAAPVPALKSRQSRPRVPEAAPRPAAAMPSAPGLTVHLFESSNACARATPSARRQPPCSAHRAEDDREAQALEEEIAFRQSPVFEEPAGPPMPLPANLIEFPRQLVAPRKARPRYAEGPLRDEEVLTPGKAQLRIFEVETSAISTTPDVALPLEGTDATSAPQWTSLWLDTPAPAASAPSGEIAGWDTPFAAPVPARLYRRLRAGAIDLSFVSLGFLGASGVVACAAVHFAPVALSGAWRSGDFDSLRTAIATSPGTAAAAAALSLAFLWVLYQVLFFTFADATPGMRLSRIGLCTFADENPTRRAMRRRALTVLLTACPLGLLWIALDNDRLAWHDRLSRMYQRSY